MTVNTTAVLSNKLGKDNQTRYTNWTTALLTTVIPPTEESDYQGLFQMRVIVPLYVLIFTLSITGNVLVLITLGQRKRLQSVTNIYLLNLAIADLLLGVFCMPFTLIGQVLRNFVFGSVMCKLIPFFQAVSVSVGVWTLVAISMERYFAICRPLTSRQWQTQGHALKIIACVWICSILWASPILFVSTLKTMDNGGQKCREIWPDVHTERAYNIFLDIILLVIPLIIMGLAYTLIVTKLWRGLQVEVDHLNEDPYEASAAEALYFSMQGAAAASSIPDNRRRGFRYWLTKIGLLRNNEPEHPPDIPLEPMPSTSNPGDVCIDMTALSARHGHLRQTRAPRAVIRSTYTDRSIDTKRRVIRMLFVVVAEFFICWAPLHVLNTWYLFEPEQVYTYVGANGVSLIQLLAYISSCCNPITYCFMNKKFRQAFFSVFTWCRPCAEACGETIEIEQPRPFVVPPGSEPSARESSVRIAMRNRTEMDNLDAEDRV